MKTPSFLAAVWLLGAAASLYGGDIAYRLKASDFARVKAQLAPHPEVHGEKILRQTSRQILLNLPAPSTDRPVYVYVKVRAESARDYLTLETYREGERYRLTEITGMPEGIWSWARFKAVKGETIGGQLRIDAAPSSKAGQAMSLESIVVADRSDLTDDELEATPLWMPSYPMVSVHRASSPPSLNGKGDDPIWQQATGIRDFFLFSSGTPAQLKTTVRFLYDARQLYVQAVMDEPLLRAADMRIEELVTRATERDQLTPHEVTNDDACLLMLQPSQSGAVYEWTVNTIGTLLDAKMSPENLWKSRKVEWNSPGARSVVTRGEARWVWELAIPWSDLGVEPPAAGAAWNVALARISPSRKENSAWNRTGRGAHLPEEWGELRFSDAPAPGVEAAAAFDKLNPGANDKAFVRHPDAGTGPHHVSTRIEPEGNLVAFHQTRLDPAASAKHRFEVAQPTMSIARWRLADAETLRPFYISPRGAIPVRSSRESLSLSTPGAWELIVNGSQVASGASADRQTVSFALRHGANHVAIRAEQSVTHLELGGKDGPWRVQATDDPGALAEAFDDRKWPIATPGEADAVEGKSLVLRKIIFSGHTQVWPVPQPALAIAKNSTQPATFKFNGLPGRSLEQWAMWVAIPEALEVKGISGFYGNFRPQQPVFSIQREGNTEIEGRSLALYRITADKPLVYDKLHAPGGRAGIFHLMLRVAEGAPEGAEIREKIHYWAEAEQGAVMELPQSFAIQSLPEVRGKQPERYVFELWGSNFGTLDSKAVRTEILHTMQAAGFNLLVDNRGDTPAHAEKYGIRIRPAVHFTSWSINLVPHLSQHPEERLIGLNGIPSDQWICTSLLLDERWPLVSGVFASLIRKAGVKSICYDHEFSTLTGPHSCFCQRCIAAFAKEKGLPPAPLPSAKEIEERHREAWDDFMAQRSARILAKMRSTVHATIPGGVFTVFSLPQSPRTVSVYGIDWRYVVSEGGADVIQVGTSGSWSHLVGTSAVAGDIPVMYGVWITPYGPSHMIPAQQGRKSELLRRVLDSTYGVLFYDRATMDGHSWRNVGETTRLVADFEELFLKGQRQEVSGVPAESAQWLSGGGKKLLCVMNHGTAPSDIAVALPDGVRNGYEYYSGDKTGGRSSLQLSLPPGESAVYVFDSSEQ